jgi:hypothetical protein
VHRRFQAAVRMSIDAGRKPALIGLASRLGEAWKSAGLIAVQNAELPVGLADAYFVQDQMAEVGGAALTGWNVGATSEHGLKIVGYGGNRVVRIAATTNAGEIGAADVILFQCRAHRTRAGAKGGARICDQHRRRPRPHIGGRFQGRRFGQCGAGEILEGAVDRALLLRCADPSDLRWRDSIVIATAPTLMDPVHFNDDAS